MRSLITRSWPVLTSGLVMLAAMLVIPLLPDARAADEIAQRVEVNLRAGLLKIEFDPGERKITQFVPVGSEIVQIVGNAMEDLEIGSDVTTNGVCWFLNTDTNPVSEEVYIEIGAGNGANFYGFLRLKSGEFATARLHPTNNIKVRTSHTNVILRGGVLHD